MTSQRVIQSASQVLSWALPAFVAISLLLGGGSRGDIISLVLLRPVTALALGYAAIRFWGGKRMESLSVPITAFAAIAALALLQLLPLPPAIWTSLPGREPIVKGLEAAGMGLGWHPVSVVPLATLNSFGAFLVPLTALMLFSIADDRQRKAAIWVLVGFAICSAIIGMLQLMGGSQNWLYPYRITNEGAPVGLFANRNHHAALLAATIPFLFALCDAQGDRKNRFAMSWGARLVSVGFVIMAVTTGSRSGTVLAFLALLASFFVLDQPSRIPLARAEPRRFNTVLRIAISIGAIAVFGTVTAIMGGNAFTRFAAKNGIEDIRFQILPDIWEMTWDAFPIGWGFGTFPQVYEIYERVELMQPAYINRAHNDWLEIVMGSGIFGPIAALAISVWSVRIIWQRRRLLLKATASWDRLATASAIGMTVLLAASLTDYPLRTPAAAVALALFLCCLGRSAASQIAFR